MLGCALQINRAIDWMSACVARAATRMAIASWARAAAPEVLLVRSASILRFRSSGPPSTCVASVIQKWTRDPRVGSQVQELTELFLALKHAVSILDTTGHEQRRLAAVEDPRALRK